MEEINQLDDGGENDFNIETDEDGIETLVEKQNPTSKKADSSLSELIGEILLELDEYSMGERYYLLNPENPDFKIIFRNGVVYAVNDEKDYFVSLTELQVIFKEMKIQEKNFWELDCRGYFMLEFTDEQIKQNREKW